MTTMESFTSPEIQKCPFPLIKKLHHEAPVTLDPETGFYVVVGYDDIAYINQHTELFSVETSIILGVGAETPAITELYDNEGFQRMNTLVTADPPNHTFYRGFVDKVFTPTFVRSLEPYMRELADELLDEIAPTGKADLLNDFCIKLPVYVIADQLGASRDHWRDFKKWSDNVIQMINPALTEDERLDKVRIHVEMQKYLEEQRSACAGRPQEDTLLSRLTHAQVDGKSLTPQEFNNIAEIMIVAGNETTTSTFAHCFTELIRRPDVRAELTSNPELIPNFVEEMLRLHAPSPHFYREVKEDVELSGVKIPKGSIVMTSYLAGNYDPVKFPEPEEIDLHRSGVRNHLAFGRGIHFCIGHQLARAELRIGIEQVLLRLKDLSFDTDHNEPEVAPLFHVHALDQLHVRFAPELAPA